MDVMNGLVGQEDYRPGINPDDALYVEIFDHPEKMNYESEQQGRPIYKTYTYIKIIPPGGRGEIVRRIRDHDKQRFPRHWQKYLAGQSQEEGLGTPVEHWGFLSVEQAATLKALGIRYVEQIAAASDSTLQHIGMGARDMKRKANAFMDASKGNADMLSLRKENESLKEEFESLKNQFIHLSEEHDLAVEQLKKGKKPKPGNEVVSA